MHPAGQAAAQRPQCRQPPSAGRLGGRDLTDYAANDNGRTAHWQLYGDDIRLVLVGPGTLASLHIPEHPAVIATGAVSEAEKSTIIRHATVMVNPSRMESLSLLLLEALHNRIPVLVNGECEVMKEHCKLSGAALWYDSGRDFRRKLHRLLSDEALRSRMSGKGPVYVREHYGWEVVIPKLRALIEKLSSGRGKGLPGAAEDGTAEG